MIDFFLNNDNLAVFFRFAAGDELFTSIEGTSKLESGGVTNYCVIGARVTLNQSSNNQ